MLPDEIKVEGYEHVVLLSPGVKSVRVPDYSGMRAEYGKLTPDSKSNIKFSVFDLDQETENYRYCYRPETKTLYYAPIQGK